MRRLSKLVVAFVTTAVLASSAGAQHLDRGALVPPAQVGRAATEASLAGLVFVKHVRVGTRSEGPDYFLQTSRGDVPLRLGERYLWEPDYRLEYYAGRIVEVTGGAAEGAFVVAQIRDLCLTRIPGEDRQEALPEEAPAADAGPRPRLRPTRASGLVFVRHGRVGTRSEGPDYFLQTVNGDIELRLAERQPWEADPALEMLVRRFVEIEGPLDGPVLHVTSARELCVTRLPD